MPFRHDVDVKKHLNPIELMTMDSTTIWDIPTLCFLRSLFTTSSFLGNFAKSTSRGSNGSSEGEAFRARCRLGLLMHRELKVT